MNALKLDTAILAYSTLDDFALLLGIETDLLNELIEHRNLAGVKHVACMAHQSPGEESSQSKVLTVHDQSARLPKRRPRRSKPGASK